LILQRFGAQARIEACRWPVPVERRCNGAYRFFSSIVAVHPRRGCYAWATATFSKLSRPTLHDRDSGRIAASWNTGFLFAYPLVAFSPQGRLSGQRFHWQSLGARIRRSVCDTPVTCAPSSKRKAVLGLKSCVPSVSWREVLPQNRAAIYVADPRKRYPTKLLAQARAPGVDLLIRAVRNRKKPRRAANCGRKRRTGRSTATGRQSLAVAARPVSAPARTAEGRTALGQKVALAPPRSPRPRPWPPIRMRVCLGEAQPSAHGRGLEPFGVDAADQSAGGPRAARTAWQVVEYYRQRWQIETILSCAQNKAAKWRALQLQNPAPGWRPAGGGLP